MSSPNILFARIDNPSGSRSGWRDLDIHHRCESVSSRG